MKAHFYLPSNVDTRSSVEQFTESYYDSRQLVLLHHNIWLRCRRWSKTSAQWSLFDGTEACTYSDLPACNAFLALRFPGIVTDKCIAFWTTFRLREPTYYIDCCDFGLRNHEVYVIATGVGTARAPAKMIAYLHARFPELYTVVPTHLPVIMSPQAPFVLPPPFINPYDSDDDDSDH
jgi:hypothetical protein